MYDPFLRSAVGVSKPIVTSEANSFSFVPKDQGHGVICETLHTRAHAKEPSQLGISPDNPTYGV